jgi:hypothetical protein
MEYITVSSAIFSYICYDNSGNFAPTIWGNAATACADYFNSVYSTTQSEPFVQYATGFCENPSFIPAGTSPVMSIGPASATIVGTTSTGGTAAQVSVNKVRLFSKC